MDPDRANSRNLGIWGLAEGGFQNKVKAMELAPAGSLRRNIRCFFFLNIPTVETLNSSIVHTVSINSSDLNLEMLDLIRF